jgi:adenylosuccinate lyase
VHFACTSEDINNTSHALQIRVGRDTVLLPASTASSPSCARWPTSTPKCPCSAAPTARPPAHHRGQGTGQRGRAPAKAAANIAGVKILGKMNGAVGNYNAHLSAWPEFDWEAFSQNVVESAEPKGWASAYTIQIEPHDYMAELFDAMARTNTILIDLSRDIWGYVSWATSSSA